MLILRRQFINLFGQSILLEIYQYTNCCEIVVSKNPSSQQQKHQPSDVRCSRNKRLCLAKYRNWYLVFTVLLCVITLFSFITDHQRMDIIFSLLTLFLLSLLFCCKSPISKESLVLLDNLSAIEMVESKCFGQSTSTFLTISHIVINEAITMQRVIYYLVAVPETCHFKREEDINFTNQSKGLVPLFQNTCPRLDCLKEIYQFIQSYKLLKHNHVKRSIESPKNGFKFRNCNHTHQTLPLKS